MKFKFETGEIIEVNDISLANVLRSDKRYKELNGDEETTETLPVNEELEKEIETLKAKNEELEKEVEELKNQLEKFNENHEPENGEPENPEPENGEE